MDFIKRFGDFTPVTEKLTSSDFNTVDGLLDDVTNYLTDTLDHKEWMGMSWEQKGDVINNAMSKVSDRHMKDKKLTNLVNKKTDDIIDYFVGSLSESLVNEGAYKKNDKGSMLTSIIKAKSAQDYGLDNLIVLHKDIKKVFTSKENKQELLHDLNNVIEYMKKADKFKAAGRSNDNTIAMVEKYWKQLSGQTVSRTQKTITEGKVNEATDINDPVLVAIRSWKTQLKKDKAAPKVKKISMNQYYKLMDKEMDLIDQMKDAAEEFEQLDSDMNAEAGQKGEAWNDDDANRYGGDLDKLQTKIEKLAKQKAKVKADIMNYRMS